MRIFFVLCLLFILICAGLYLWGKAGAGTSADAQDLMLDMSAFPPGWSYDRQPQSAREDEHILRAEGASDFALVIFVPPNVAPGSTSGWDKAGQVVWNFDSKLAALIETYGSRFQYLWDRLSMVDPQEWSYRSEVADQYRLFCGIVETRPEFGPSGRGGWKVCGVIAQYGRFVTEFNSPVGPEYHMTPEDWRRILQAIDERMARYVKDVQP